MQQKKSLFIFIVLALAVGIITYAAASELQSNSDAVSFFPDNAAQKPQFLNAFGHTGKGRLKQPMALAVDQQKKIYVTDAGTANIKVYSSDGQYIKSVGSKGAGNGEFGYPYGIVVLPNGEIVIADSENLNVRIFSNDGRYVRTILGAAQKTKPGALAVGDKGQIYISDLLNHQIIVMDAKGKLLRKLKPAASSFSYPQEIVLGQGDRELWVADSGNFAVKQIDRKGLVAGTIREWGVPPQPFSLVRGIGLDKQNRLMIADTLNGTIHVMTRDGRVVFSFDGLDSPAGAMIYPSFIYVDASGKIYIADRGAGQVQVWGYDRQ